ncbi:hypothetical protein [Oculatella sp. LEGE 06141]|uniref:hypothetical protein n=1 Tax=Oculatella sp. LEGE 06141 TaxID=1828648 RepID=UPI001881AD62|nr:hypothetical protein [Oculatella sp. LEGE 06141]
MADLNSTSYFDQSWHTLGQYSTLQPIVAQEFQTNVFDGFWDSMDNFIESGQVWALLIGFILGYVIKSLTSYG